MDRDSRGSWIPAFAGMTGSVSLGMATLCGTPALGGGLAAASASLRPPFHSQPGAAGPRETRAPGGSLKTERSGVLGMGGWTE